MPGSGDRRPPREAWFVVEVDIASDREDSLYCNLRGPFPTRVDAVHEMSEQKTAWNRVLEESDKTNPYDFKGWDIVETHLTDFQIDKLERQDEESYRVTREAADAVAGSMLTELVDVANAGDSSE
jgi:hypothetical protein